LFFKSERIASSLVSVSRRGFQVRRLMRRQLNSGGSERPHDAIRVIAPLYLYRLGNIDPWLAVLTKLRSPDDIPKNISKIAMSHVLHFLIPNA
jgi:hypothetical protein